jgi:hypothetical protein
MTINELLHRMTSAEISEWMAFDRLKDEEYFKQLQADRMTDQQRSDALKALLSGVK